MLRLSTEADTPVALPKSNLDHSAIAGLCIIVRCTGGQELKGEYFGSDHPSDATDKMAVRSDFAAIKQFLPPADE